MRRYKNLRGGVCFFLFLLVVFVVGFGFFFLLWFFFCLIVGGGFFVVSFGLCFFFFGCVFAFGVFVVWFVFFFLCCCCCGFFFLFFFDVCFFFCVIFSLGPCSMRFVYSQFIGGGDPSSCSGICMSVVQLFVFALRRDNLISFRTIKKYRVSEPYYVLIFPCVVIF